MVYRYFIFSIILFSIQVSFSHAQEKGFSKLENTASLEQQLEVHADNSRTLSSDFIQEKEMSLMEDVIVSNGKFYFKKDNKVRIEYTRPFEYLLIMNGGQITIKDDGKVNKINTRNSSSMQSVNQLIMDCMRGTVFENKNFFITAYENHKDYLLILKPKEASLKMMFSDIRLYLNKSDKSVHQLIMKENSGDETIMKFSNIKINQDLPDALFTIR